jgi:hypothetical protein
VKTQTLFFEDLATALDYWIQESADALTNPSTDLAWVDHPAAFRAVQSVFARENLSRDALEQCLSECLRGLVVSALTIIDGGTELSGHGRIRLVDTTGESLGEGLHEEFVSHLLESNRLQ